VLAVVGFVTDANTVEGDLYSQIARRTSAATADALRNMVESVNEPGGGGLRVILTIATLLLTSTAVFIHLQTSLNTVWGVRLRGSIPLVEKIKQRLIAFAAVPAIGLLLLLALVLNTGLSGVGSFIDAVDVIPSQGTVYALQAAALGISFVLVTLMFAVVYKTLPNVRIAWRDVWIGAAVTGLLFVIGQFLLGFYLARQTGSAYGAAGALLLFLLWIYYSTQILFLGAEFTQVYARHRGRQIEPDEYAYRMTPSDRFREGIGENDRESERPAPVTPPVVP
jgi:membrane protein